MSEPAKRIAYLCLETPHEGQATFTHVHEIIDGLKASGWSVELFATGAGGSSSGSPLWRRGLGYVAAQWHLIRSLAQFDAVYMRAHFAALPASLWCAWRGKPVIQEINGRPDDILVTYPGLGWLGSLIRASYRWQMARAARVITVTEGLRAWAMTTAGHDRVSLVCNGANTTLFTPEGPEAGLPGPYVAFVGGLVAWHGVATMLAALDRPEWPDGVRLVVIGDGVERDRLRAAQGHPRLNWLGRMPYAAVPAYLRGALAALCVIEDPHGRSATGVAPLKLFEAMASGVPVIVTDLPFQADLVRAEAAGLVVPMADPAALAQAVVRLAGLDRASRQAMGLKGVAYARTHASWQARANETAALLTAAIAAGGQHGRG